MQISLGEWIPNHPCFRISVADTDWDPNGADLDGEPWHRLSGPKFEINGCPMHFEAWAVERGLDGILHPVNRQLDRRHRRPPRSDRSRGEYYTTTIMGHEYVLVLFPFRT